MRTGWKVGVLLAVVLTFGLGLLLRPHFVPAQGGKAQPTKDPSPRYSVVHTEALNLIVTDNKTNTLYFYAIDEGKQVGAELKLRGSIDLNKVGAPVLKPQRPGGKK